MPPPHPHTGPLSPQDKEFDPAALKLPPSLVEELMACVPEDDHPDPQPGVSEQARALFTSTYDFNRSGDQRPVYTGNNQQPNQNDAMY